jgi:hypothetical protein
VGLSVVERARAWVVAVHPHARHLERTLDWVLVLEPGADEALQVAAVAHDIERAFPPPEGEQPAGAEDPANAAEYNAWHQERSARLLGDWLREQDAPAALSARACALVRVHEDGGWPEADLLQAADSLSFLEVQADLFARLLGEGRITRRAAEEKVQLMYDRMRVPQALELGGPLLERAHARIAAVAHDRQEVP